MHWSLYVLAGAAINVLVNAGYKMNAAKESLFFMASGVAAICAITLFIGALVMKTGKISDILSGWTPLVIAGMGTGSALVLILMVSALSKGPISLVDPLWACIYTLISVGIGMILLREAPGLVPLAGVALYLAGAFLMSKGS